MGGLGHGLISKDGLPRGRGLWPTDSNPWPPTQRNERQQSRSPFCGMRVGFRGFSPDASQPDQNGCHPPSYNRSFRVQTRDQPAAYDPRAICTDKIHLLHFGARINEGIPPGQALPPGLLHASAHVKSTTGKGEVAAYVTCSREGNPAICPLPLAHAIGRSGSRRPRSAW